MEPNIRVTNTQLYEELLERIVDRGMVLDGMSRLAALGTSAVLSAHTSCDEPDNRRVPDCLMWPPRSRNRD